MLIIVYSNEIIDFLFRRIVWCESGGGELLPQLKSSSHMRWDGAGAVQSVGFAEEQDLSISRAPVFNSNGRCLRGRISNDGACPDAVRQAEARAARDWDRTHELAIRR